MDKLREGGTPRNSSLGRLTVGGGDWSHGSAATVVSTALIIASVVLSSWRSSDCSFAGRRSGAFGVRISLQPSEVRLEACCAKRAIDSLFSGVHPYILRM